MFKIANSPGNLSDFVPVIGQRHDEMVVDLGHGIAVPANLSQLSLSASIIASYIRGAKSSSQRRSVGPKLKLSDL